MILLIDNYDSFVFNLQRYLRRIQQETVVVRNDEVPLADIRAGRFRAIVISPGPKAPQQAGQSLQVIGEFYRQVPMLGVCLGHQAICEALGGRIVRAGRPVHGGSSSITYTPSKLFDGLPNPFEAARYHSLVAEPESLPPELEVIGTCPADNSADSSQRIIMAVQHVRYPVFGVQFHPESILSEVGYQILANFLKIAGLACPEQLPAGDFITPSIWSNFRQSAPVAEEMPPVVLPRTNT